MLENISLADIILAYETKTSPYRLVELYMFYHPEELPELYLPGSFRLDAINEISNRMKEIEDCSVVRADQILAYAAGVLDSHVSMHLPDCQVHQRMLQRELEYRKRHGYPTSY